MNTIEIQHITTLRNYCEVINIPIPISNDYDVRTFEENMTTVVSKMAPFRHEFYGVALKLEGGGHAKTGIHSTEDLEATVFFNSPYQITSWDIIPDWKGYYILFTEDFYNRYRSDKRLVEQFPFLLVDNNHPLKIDADQKSQFKTIFDEIVAEHKNRREDSDEIIFNYVKILLLQVNRLYMEQRTAKDATNIQRNADLELVSRFKSLVEIAFRSEMIDSKYSPHQVQYYADKLNLHPNHLSAIVKRITLRSALEHIQNHVLSLAKSRLKNSSLSVKEIAFQLQYEYPNHFSAFFKKMTGQTAASFRKS